MSEELSMLSTANSRQQIYKANVATRADATQTLPTFERPGGCSVTDIPSRDVGQAPKAKRTRGLWVYQAIQRNGGTVSARTANARIPGRTKIAATHRPAAAPIRLITKTDVRAQERSFQRPNPMTA